MYKLNGLSTRLTTFEKIAGEILRTEGYDVHESGIIGTDGGWDARLCIMMGCTTPNGMSLRTVVPDTLISFNTEHYDRTCIRREYKPVREHGRRVSHNPAMFIHHPYQQERIAHSIALSSHSNNDY